MIPLPFIEPKAGYPIYRLKLERLQQLLPGASAGLDTLCEGVLGARPFVMTDRDAPLPIPSRAMDAGARRIDGRGRAARRLPHGAVARSILLGRRDALAVGGDRRGGPAAPRSLAQPPDSDDGRRGDCRRRRWSRCPSAVCGGPVDFGAVGAGAAGLAGDVLRRHLGRSAAAVAARQAGGVTGHRRLPRLPARRHRPRRLDPLSRHAHCHGVVRGPVPRDEPPRQHGRPGRRRRADRGVVPGGAAGAAARARPGAAPRRAGRRAGRVPVLEPAAGAALHGRFGEPVHRRRARRRVARAGAADADRVRQPGRAGGADPHRAALRHQLRAGAAAAGRAEGVERRHRPRVAPPGVARLLRAQRRPDPVSPGARRRVCRLGAGHARGVEPMALVAVFTVLLGLFGIYLARVPAYNAQDFVALQKSSFAPFLKDLAFRWHAGRGAAGPGAHHGVLLRRLPDPLRGPGARHLPAVLHRVAARGARLPAARALRVRPLPAHVGHLRPARPGRRGARRRHGNVAHRSRWLHSASASRDTSAACW